MAACRRKLSGHGAKKLNGMKNRLEPDEYQVLTIEIQPFDTQSGSTSFII